MVLNVNRANIPSIRYMHNKIITHSQYPLQDTEKLGKIVRIGYKDESMDQMNTRFNLSKRFHPTLQVKNEGVMTFFKILRWDSVYPYRVILMSFSSVDRGKVIITTVDEVQNLCYPPNYLTKENEIEPVNIAGTFDSFIEFYNRDHVFKYPIQKLEYLGLPTFIEYWNDLPNYDKSDSIIEQEMYNWKIEREKIRKGILERDITDKSLRVNQFPYGLFFSFKRFHDMHHNNYTDDPRRVLGRGFMIRLDGNSYSDIGECVVAEIMDDNTLRFICGDEASLFVYSDDIVAKRMTRLEIADLILDDGYELNEGNYNENNS